MTGFTMMGQSAFNGLTTNGVVILGACWLKTIIYVLQSKLGVKKENPSGISPKSYKHPGTETDGL